MFLVFHFIIHHRHRFGSFNLNIYHRNVNYIIAFVAAISIVPSVVLVAGVAIVVVVAVAAASFPEHRSTLNYKGNVRVIRHA